MLDGEPVVGGHDDDGDVRPHNGADAPGRLDAVHIRHLPVHQDHVEIPAIVLQTGHQIHRLAAAVHPLGLDAHLPQGRNRALADRHIVVHHQRF